MGTTLHTVSGTGPGACNYWGCRSTYSFGSNTFHMKVEYGNDGRFTITRDGQQISGDSLDPPASGNDWGIVQSTYQSKGGIIYSSQLTGSWSPLISVEVVPVILMDPTSKSPISESLVL